MYVTRTSRYIMLYIAFGIIRGFTQPWGVLERIIRGYGGSTVFLYQYSDIRKYTYNQQCKGFCIFQHVQIVTLTKAKNGRNTTGQILSHYQAVQDFNA
jgi:hypothetical protein